MVDSSDKPKVLIVDDTPENVQILMETRAGFLNTHAALYMKYECALDPFP